MALWIAIFGCGFVEIQNKILQAISKKPYQMYLYNDMAFVF